MYQAVSTTEPMMGAQYHQGENYSVAKEQVRPMRMQVQNSPKCNDWFFAVVFLVNVSTIVFFAGWKGTEALSFVEKKTEKHDEKLSSYENLYYIVAALAATSLIVSLVWLRILLFFAQHLIRISLWMNVGLMIAFSVVSFSVNIWVSIVFMVLSLLNVCYIYFIRNRIEFASANLKCACRAISTHGSIIAVSFFILVVQLTWWMLWSLSTLGVYQLFREADANCEKEEKNGQLCGGSATIGTFFALLFALYWGQQVIQNILTCTVAGTVAGWWYQENSSGAVGGALRRSLTTSFGSICFGSLIVAVLQTLEAIANFLKQQAMEDDNPGLACLACLAECILGCLRSIMEYINMWAYCYVGIYGYDFRTSGKAVMDLFNNRGFTAIINDDLTGSALFFSAIGVALITSGLGILVAATAPDSWMQPLSTSNVRYATLGTAGFISGFFMALVLTTVITSAVHTIFVCFAEDPLAFARTHPEYHADLVYAWKKFQPDVMISAYGEYI